MKLRPFIVVYSAALLLWLGLTFVTPISAQRYRKPSASATAPATPKADPTAQAEGAEQGDEEKLSASASH